MKGTPLSKVFHRPTADMSRFAMRVQLNLSLEPGHTAHKDRESSVLEWRCRLGYAFPDNYPVDCPLRVPHPTTSKALVSTPVSSDSRRTHHQGLQAHSSAC